MKEKCLSILSIRARALANMALTVLSHFGVGLLGYAVSCATVFPLAYAVF